MFLLEFNTQNEIKGILRNPYEIYSNEEIEEKLAKDNFILLDELPELKKEKDGYINKLIMKKIDGERVVEYVLVPRYKSNMEIFKEEILKEVENLKNKNNIYNNIMLFNLKPNKEQLKIMFENEIASRDVLINKIKNNSLYLKDYEYITGEEFPILSFTKLELIENKVRELRDNTFERISQGIISNISGEDLWYKYDIKDQINFLDSCNIINLSNLVDKGSIELTEDFPLKNEVNIGDKYKITHMVADNKEGRTNTGKIYNADDVIVWNGKDWVSISFFENIKWNAYKPNKDKEIKQEVILSINKFKSLYSEIGLKKKDFIDRCNYKIGLIEKLNSLDEIYNYDVSIPHLIDEYQMEVGDDSE